MNKLRQHMDEKGMSCEQVAQLAGVTSKTVWNATQGRKPHPVTQKAIAAALGTSVDEVFPVAKKYYDSNASTESA